MVENFLKFENPSVKKLSLRWVICGMFVAMAAEMGGWLRSWG